MTPTPDRDAAEALEHIQEWRKSIMEAKVLLPDNETAQKAWDRALRTYDTAEKAIRKALSQQGWMPISTAKKDGRKIIVWVEHISEYGHDPEDSHATIAHWTDFNGGGWVWHGLAGKITKWLPVYDAEKILPAPPRSDREG